jgi:hypothetical protein
MAEARFIQPRDPRGLYLTFEQRVKNLMVQEAIEFQADVAKVIRSKKLRKEDSTGRLERVTKEPGNRDPQASVWRVGIPSYLNRSEAKYWRLIEQGSEGLYAKGRGFRGTALMFNPTGVRGGRKFRSFKNKKMQDDVYRGKFYSKGLTKGRGVRVVRVTKEIAPMNAYRTAFDEFGWRNRIKRDFEQTVADSFFR